MAPGYGTMVPQMYAPYGAPPDVYGHQYGMPPNAFPNQGPGYGMPGPSPEQATFGAGYAPPPTGAWGVNGKLGSPDLILYTLNGPTFYCRIWPASLDDTVHGWSAGVCSGRTGPATAGPRIVARQAVGRGAEGASARQRRFAATGR